MHKTKSHILGVYFGIRPLKPLAEPLSQWIKLWITKPKIFEREQGFEFRKFKDLVQRLRAQRLSHKQGSWEELMVKEELIFCIQNEIKFDWLRKGEELKVISGKRGDGNPRNVWGILRTETCA